MEYNKFTPKIAREIALKNFGHLLDCMLGYSDSGYVFNQNTDYFEQNFEDDLSERGIRLMLANGKNIDLLYSISYAELEILHSNKLP